MDQNKAAAKAKKLGMTWVVMDTSGRWWGCREEPVRIQFGDWTGKGSIIGRATMEEWKNQSIIASKLEIK